MAGLLGKGITKASEYIKVGEVHNTANYAVVKLNIANEDQTEATIKVYISTSDIPATGDLIVSSKKLGVGQDYEITCMTLSPGEKIYVFCDKAGLICRTESIEDLTVSN